MKYIIILIVISIPLVLVSCKEKKTNQDLHSHIDKIKKTTEVKKETVQTFKMAAASKYQGHNKRSPFKPVVHKLSRNSPAGPLVEFALSELKFIGTLQKNNQLLAVILTPDGRVYDVNIGELMGHKAAKVVSISHETVELQEFVNVNNARVKSKVIQLKLVSS